MNGGYYTGTNSIVTLAYEFELEYGSILDNAFYEKWLPWKLRAPKSGLGISTVAVSLLI